MTDSDEIPVREAAKQQPAPTAVPPASTAPAPTTALPVAPAPARVATTRVWSLIGCGHVDEVMGVRFDRHYVDVDAETAAKLVARRQQNLVQVDDGAGGFTEHDEPLEMYSTTRPDHIPAQD